MDAFIRDVETVEDSNSNPAPLPRTASGTPTIPPPSDAAAFRTFVDEHWVEISHSGGVRRPSREHHCPEQASELQLCWHVRDAVLIPGLKFFAELNARSLRPPNMKLAQCGCQLRRQATVETLKHRQPSADLWSVD